VLKIAWFNLSRRLTNLDKEYMRIQSFSCAVTLEYAPLEKTSVRPHGFKWDKSPAASLLRHIRRVSKPYRASFSVTLKAAGLYGPFTLSLRARRFIRMITHSSILFGFVDSAELKRFEWTEATINLTHVALHWPSGAEECYSFAPGWSPRVVAHSRLQFI